MPRYTRSVLLIAAALLLAVLFAACADDGDGSGGTGGTAAGSTTSTTTNTAGGAMSLSGTACGQDISCTAPADARIEVYQETSGELQGILVLDGERFDADSEAAWAAYAAEHDVLMVLWFNIPEPATPHTVNIHDSFFAARGIGGISFQESGAGEEVVIEAIDLNGQTIQLSFTIPVYAMWPSYPPIFDQVDECHQGTLSGTIQGPFTVVDVR